MSTMSHPAPLAPRKKFNLKVSRPAARKATVAEPAADSQTPSPYTRSALPVALTWFLLPALLLVIMQAFGWKL